MLGWEREINETYLYFRHGGRIADTFRVWRRRFRRNCRLQFGRSFLGTADKGGAYTLAVLAEAPGSLQADDFLQVGNTIFVAYQDSSDNPDGTIAAGVKSAHALESTPCMGVRTFYAKTSGFPSAPHQTRA